MSSLEKTHPQSLPNPPNWTINMTKFFCMVSTFTLLLHSEEKNRMIGNKIEKKTKIDENKWEKNHYKKILVIE